MRAHHRLEEPMAAVQAVARRAALHLQLVVPASVRRDVVRARAFVIQAGRGVPVVQVPHFVRPGPLVPATAHAAQRWLPGLSSTHTLGKTDDAHVASDTRGRFCASTGCQATPAECTLCIHCRASKVTVWHSHICTMPLAQGQAFADLATGYAAGWPIAFGLVTTSSLTSCPT